MLVGKIMKTKLIFISGMPSTGKTTVAYKLALKLKAEKVISIDLVKTLLRTFNTKESKPYLYTTTHEASEIEKLDTIPAYYKHCQIFEEPLLNLLKQLANEKYVVIEGVQVTKNLLTKIDLENFEIIAFNLYIENKKIYRKRIKNKLKNRMGNWLKSIDKINLIEKELLNNNFINLNNKNSYFTVRKILKELKNESLYIK